MPGTMICFVGFLLFYLTLIPPMFVTFLYLLLFGPIKQSEFECIVICLWFVQLIICVLISHYNEKSKMERWRKIKEDAGE